MQPRKPGARAAAVLAAVLLWSQAGHAAAQEVGSGVTAEQVDPPVAAPEPKAEPVWVGGLSAGWIDRASGSATPFASLGLTRYSGPVSIRASYTVYRSTLQQIDAALPSTFHLGTIGAGGNWSGWIADGSLTAGWQKFGQVETALGGRDSTAGAGAVYFSATARFGRELRIGGRLYLTPSMGAQLVLTKALRTTIDMGQAVDMVLDDRSASGSAGLKLQRVFGRDRQSYGGVACEYTRSSNGLTILTTIPPSGSPEPGGPPQNSTFAAGRTPDSWLDCGGNLTLRVGRSYWLDAEVHRTSGLVAGDMTTMLIGLRRRF